MLETVVGDDDVDGAAGQKVLNVGDSIRAGYDRTSSAARQ
jgi:hypothetical protein